MLAGSTVAADEAAPVGRRRAGMAGNGISQMPCCGDSGTVQPFARRLGAEAQATISMLSC